MKGEPHYFRTLGVHPVGLGFGWVACEGPFRLVEAGLFTPIRGNAELASLRQFGKILARFQPGELVLEAFESGDKRRSQRSKKLGIAIVTEAVERGLAVESYSRRAVQDAFAAVGARTREEVAEAVARHFSGLKLRLPKKRAQWDAEDRRLAIFNAAAAVIAHFHNGGTALLDDLRNAA